MTNLEGGFRIRATRLTDALPRMQAFRAEMLRVVDDLSASVFAREAATRFDSMLLGGDYEPNDGPLAGLYTEAWSRQHENRHTPIGSWPEDLRANMVLIPHQGDVIGVFQAGQREWQELWRAKDGVEALDLVPGSAPDDELAARRATWSSLLGDDLSAPLQMVGIEKTIHHGDHSVHKPDHIADFSPPYEWRVDTQTCAALGTTPESADRNTDAYRLHRERIASILPELLTGEMLLHGPARPTDTETPVPGARA